MLILSNMFLVQLVKQVSLGTFPKDYTRKNAKEGLRDPQNLRCFFLGLLQQETTHCHAKSWSLPMVHDTQQTLGTCSVWGGGHCQASGGLTCEGHTRKLHSITIHVSLLMQYLLPYNITTSQSWMSSQSEQTVTWSTSKRMHLRHVL